MRRYGRSTAVRSFTAARRYESCTVVGLCALHVRAICFCGYLLYVCMHFVVVSRALRTFHFVMRKEKKKGSSE